MVDFDIDFEKDLLACALQSDEFAKSASRILERSHFTTDAMSWTWSAIKDTWIEHGERPSARVLLSRAKREITKEEKLTETLKAISEGFKAPIAPKSMLAELTEFVRTNHLQEALEESLKRGEKGDWKGAWEPIRSAVREELRPKAYTSIDWIEEFEARQAARKFEAEHPEATKAIKTGIARLDSITGGHRIGEVGLVMGTTGRGKSIFLNHLGFQAAWRGFSVLHFALEMPALQVATRYDSRFTGQLYRKFKTHDFSADELKDIALRVDRMRAKFKKRLRIVSMPVQSADIIAVKDILQEARETRDVHLIIVDSGDHLRALNKRKDFRLEQTEVYWGMKALAEEEEVACWSSTHAGREWASKIATAEAAAESYDKSRIADTVLTLNAPSSSSRTSIIDDDDDDDSGDDDGIVIKPDLEAFLAKYRDGESKVRIPLETDFARMHIKEALASAE